MSCQQKESRCSVVLEQKENPTQGETITQGLFIEMPREDDEDGVISENEKEHVRGTEEEKR